MYLSSSEELPLPVGDTHIEKVWFCDTGEESTARLLDSLDGEERDRLWNTQKEVLASMELAEAKEKEKEEEKEKEKEEEKEEKEREPENERKDKVEVEREQGAETAGEEGHQKNVSEEFSERNCGESQFADHTGKDEGEMLVDEDGRGERGGKGESGGVWRQREMKRERRTFREEGEKI